MSTTEELRDAIVTVPIVASSTFEGGGGRLGSNEQRVRNITRWSEVDGSLVIYRDSKEVARFKEWISIRTQAVD